MADGPINISNTIKADKDGLVEIPKVTNTMIDNGSDKVIPTKEWIEDKIAIINLALAAVNTRINNL